MTKGWKIGLGVFAGIMVIGGIANINKARDKSAEQTAPAALTNAAQAKAEPVPAKAVEPEAAGITMVGYQRIRTGMTTAKS